MKKIIILLSMLFLSGCSNNNETYTKMSMEETRDLNQSDMKLDITQENADTLDISVSYKEEKDKYSIKVSNTSDIQASNITLIYEELDKNENVILQSQINVATTINEDEVIYVDIPHGKYTDMIDVVEYEYEYLNNRAYINLKSELIKIEYIDRIIEDSINYEVLNISQVNKTNDKDIYSVKVKNLSNKHIGNIVLKFAELNEDGEYIYINNIPVLDVLDPSKEIEIKYTPVKNYKDLSIIGYMYDDINEKSNIDIDLKNHSARLNKYK